MWPGAKAGPSIRGFPADSAGPAPEGGLRQPALKSAAFPAGRANFIRQPGHRAGSAVPASRPCQPEKRRHGDSPPCFCPQNLARLAGLGQNLSQEQPQFLDSGTDFPLSVPALPPDGQSGNRFPKNLFPGRPNRIESGTDSTNFVPPRQNSGPVGDESGADTARAEIKRPASPKKARGLKRGPRPKWPQKRTPAKNRRGPYPPAFWRPGLGSCPHFSRARFPKPRRRLRSRAALLSWARAQRLVTQILFSAR